jgi:hypothetical protein
MTRDELRAVLARNPQLSTDENQTGRSVRGKAHQSKRKNALGSKVSGTEEGLDRPIVRFVGYRVRPCDPDGFPRSCKDLLDGLHHAGIIHGDEPWNIILQTEQVKVRSTSEERTEIEIITPL